MTLEELRALQVKTGIRLRSEGDRIRIIPPAGVAISPEVVEAVRRHKAGLLMIHGLHDLIHDSPDFSSWEMEALDLIQVVMARIEEACPPNWRIGHGSTDWAGLNAQIDDAFHAQNTEALESSLEDLEKAAGDSFWRRRDQFLDMDQPMAERPGEPPSVPCFCCRGTRFWKHAQVHHWVCWTCHPPADRKDVAQELDVEGPEEEPGEWDEETGELVTWFIETGQYRIPSEPFHLVPWIHVSGPDKFREALLFDISSGPRGPRNRYGALREDLKRLKGFLESFKQGFEETNEE